MGDLLGVSVEDLVALLKGRKARLPFEIGAFVALETCETLLDGPASVGPADVRIADDGTVSVYAPPDSATGADAARSVVAVLARLLIAAGPGVPPVLLHLVEHGPSDGRWDLNRLRDELEASLIPLNRAAARRVLSRLLREVQREPTRRSERPGRSAEPGDVDADLDDFLGPPSSRPPPPRGEPAPPPPAAPVDEELDELLGDATSSPPPPPEPRLSLPRGVSAQDTLRESDVRPSSSLPRGVAGSWPRQPIESGPAAIVRGEPTPTADVDEEELEEVATPEPRRAPAAAPRAPRRSPRAEPGPTTQPVARRKVELDGFEDLPTGRGRGLRWLLVAVVVLGGAGAGVWFLRPDLVQSVVGSPVETPPSPAVAAPASGPVRPGDLVVRVTPERAQVLLFVGHGPAVARNLEVGVAHEFIAIAEGHAPTRAVVPAAATWPEVEGRRLYELAMQAGETPMALEDLALGDSRLTRDGMGTSSGQLGDVRVVTSPPRAKVYQLIGFGPVVRVRDLPTDEGHEILVWDDGHQVGRVVVGPSDWTGDGDRREAEVDVHLEPAE